MKFYSQSKKAYLETADAPLPHLNNLKAKIERGEYRDHEGEVLSADEEKALMEAIDTEIARRAEAAAQDEGFA